MALTTQQIEIVRSTVPILQHHGLAITTVFYKNLLDDIPDLNNTFNKTHQEDGHQARALAQSVLAYATHITDLGVLSPTIERIAQKHVSLGIIPEQYDIIGKYLLAAMGQVLGGGLTPSILDAWAAAYGQLASVFINREKVLYGEKDIWIGYREFRIKDKVAEAEDITSFYLEPADNRPLPPHLPGEYISLQLHVPELGYLQSRQYSLSSIPNSSFYRISIKRDNTEDQARHFTQPGLISNLMHDHRSTGDVVKVSYPRGDFHLNPKTITTSPKVLISVGVGLTPLVSILTSLQSLPNPPRISWIHGTRSTKQQAFAGEIQDLKDKQTNLTTRIFKSNIVRGDIEGRDYDFGVRMDLNRVKGEDDLFLGDHRAEYFVCGPEKFMSEISRSLIQRGVDERRIYLELFGTGEVER